MNWAYCVMTVPMRRRTTLPGTLASLREAGFPRPHLFVDGDCDGKSWRDELGLDVTCRYPAVRIHGNWWLSIMEMFVLSRLRWQAGRRNDIEIDGLEPCLPLLGLTAG